MTRLAPFDDVLRSLESIPAHPRSLVGPQNWLNGALLLADYLASVPPSMPRIAAKIRKYPPDFEKVAFRSADGTRLVGWLGRAKTRPGRRRPGLILVPGLFTSKDNHRIRGRSVKILREWGFHILTLDLRGVGESERNPITPGHKEAEDLEAAVDWFRQAVDPAPTHLYCESLAAAAVLVAAGRTGEAGRALVDGRILSVSPYADPRPILERYSGPVDWSDRQFAPVKVFFKGVLRMAGTKDWDFDAYTRDAAVRYGIPYDRLVALSTPLDVIARSRSETLILHSEDDVMIPVEHARRLEAAVKPNPRVRVQILSWGNHCLHEMADPDWYWKALPAFYEARPARPSSRRARPAGPARRRPRP